MVAVIALVAGELTAYLTVNKDDYSRGLREARTELNRTGADIGRDTDRIGRDSGGKLAQGMRQGFIRNSPLIVAGVGAALAAGAPVALAGATTLFGGIGAVAAAQSVAVRSAWTSLGREIRDGAVADAAVLIPTYVRMADQIGAAFQRMRPQLRDAFEAAGPQIDSFTDSLVRAAENAMPGLVRAVQSAGPVVGGLGSLLESVGTGLTGFFDAMSDNAPAAGQAFAAIGDIVGSLLPILGELLGQGAELASMVLPPLAGILGVVADAAGALGPLLPGIALGFAGFKAASTAATYLQTFAVQAQYATTAMTGSVSAGTKVGGVLSGLGRALPAVGVAVGVVASAMSAAEQRTDDFARSLLEGGAAAAAAQEEMGNPSFWDKFLFNLTNWGNTEEVATRQTREANDAMRESLAAMDPVSRSKALLRQATNDLSAALEGEGKYAGDVAGAQRNYESASREAEAAQSALELAIDGVTSSMIEQATQALAAANGQFAYEQAIDSTEDSLAAYNEAVKESGAGSEEASDAQRQLSMDMLAQAEAAGRAAQENSGLGDSLKGQQVAASATLTELYRLRDLYGAQFPPALQNAIAGLEASGAAIDGVSANSSIASGMVRNFIGNLLDLGQQKPTPVANLNAAPLQGATQTSFNLLGVLNGQRPTPVAQMDANPLNVTAQWAAGRVAAIGAMRVFPQANLVAYTSAAEAALNYAARARTTVITAIQRILPGGAGGGQVGAITRGFAFGGTPSRAPNGRLSGAGGPTDDMIPAITNLGELIRVANREWIVPGFVADRQGPSRMAALTAGMADIVMRRPGVRGFASGGSPDVNPVTGTGHAVAPAPVVNVNVYGVDFSNRQDRRRLVMEIKQGLVEVGRAES